MRRAGALLLTAVLFPTGALWAQGPPSRSGPEFQVNTYTTGGQREASLAMTAGGDFVVVWTSYAGSGSDSIEGRILDASGSPVGGEFQVNTYTTGYRKDPAVAVDGTGNFVVVWSGAGAGGSYVISGRRFDHLGAPIGTEFQVNTYSEDTSRPAVLADPNGPFVVVWENRGADGDSLGIFARRFNAAGVALDTQEFQINSFTTGDQASPAIAGDAASGFTVVWAGSGSGDPAGVFGRQFGANGAPLGGEFAVNSTTTDVQDEPSIAADSTGNFVVAWESYAQDGDALGVFGQRFGSNGSAKGQEFQVNTYTTNNQDSPSIAMNSAGDFVVTWRSLNQDGSGDGVFGQAFRSSGASVGSEFQVNTYTSYDQAGPSVGIDAFGNFAVAWQSDNEDGDSAGIFAQIFCAGGQDRDDDGVCDATDNCPNTYNPTQSDADGDGLGDACDVYLTSPTNSQSLDCTDPNTIRPTISWTKGNYDGFRVFFSPDPGFPKTNRVSSGDTLLRDASYTPRVRKWRRACKKAIAANPSSTIMYVRVFGVDTALPTRDPNRKTYSQTVQTLVIH